MRASSSSWEMASARISFSSRLSNDRISKLQTGNAPRNGPDSTAPRHRLQALRPARATRVSSELPDPDCKDWHEEGGFGVALVEPWGSLGVALVEPWWSLGGALVEPWGGFGVALRWLWCGLGVAL